MTPDPIASPPVSASLPSGFRITIDTRLRVWADGSVLVGGSPWRISRVGPTVRDLVVRLLAAGPQGIALATPLDLAAGRQLLNRGFADPVAVAPRPVGVSDAVIPAMDHADQLAALLASLTTANVVVVDDGSLDRRRVAEAATAGGARLLSHDHNRGPAAARNTGLAETCSPIVAFIDSDCIAPPDWPSALLYHFDDPAVGAVAPRVAPTDDRRTVLERYETTRSSLDMGRRAELVRPGGRLGFVPSAALLVRRSALTGNAFDEQLRLGEDVDLIWRLVEAGWLVRYDPSVVVQHRTRTKPAAWILRRYQYGTSAASLEARHPGRLAPARVSFWNLAAIALLTRRQPLAGVTVSAFAATALWREIHDLPRSPLLATRTVAQGVLADSAALGHLLRREWWPIGMAALALAPRSHTARVCATCMLTPIALEWITQRPPLDPARYTALRLFDDAAYGSGVITASIKDHMIAPLRPRIRWPKLRKPPLRRGIVRISL